MKRQTVKNKQPIRKVVRRQVKMAVVPHKANEYQPHLIRNVGLVLAIILIVGVQVLYNLTTTGQVMGEKADISMAALLSGTNSARQAHDLSDLKLDAKLNQAAYLKAKDMFSKQYWSHDAPDGTKPWKWFSEAGYSYSEAGENLAKNFYTADATMTAWLNSEGHRANILNPRYTDVGFAVASGTLNDKPTTIVVALYGHPAEADEGMTSAAIAGAKSGPIDPLTRIGIGLQSITPAALGSIILLIFMMIVAFAAHLYRDHLPKSLHHSRHRHNHGAIKAGGILSAILTLVLLYGGGQI